MSNLPKEDLFLSREFNIQDLNPFFLEPQNPFIFSQKRASLSYH
jgi:hypothetical protein